MSIFAVPRVLNWSQWMLRRESWGVWRIPGAREIGSLVKNAERSEYLCSPPSSWLESPPSHISMQAVHAVPSRASIALPCSTVRIRALARIAIRLSAEAKAEKWCQGWGFHPFSEGDHAFQDLYHGFHSFMWRVANSDRISPCGCVQVRRHRRVLTIKWLRGVGCKERASRAPSFSRVGPWEVQGAMWVAVLLQLPREHCIFAACSTSSSLHKIRTGLGWQYPKDSPISIGGCSGGVKCPLRWSFAPWPRTAEARHISLNDLHSSSEFRWNC